MSTVASKPRSNKDLEQASLATGWFEAKLAENFGHNAEAFEQLSEHTRQTIRKQFCSLASDFHWMEKLRKHDDARTRRLRQYLASVNLLLAMTRIHGP